MKKIVLIVCSFFMFFSCTTTKGINDYDPISFEKKTYDESEILGKVTVSKLDWVWSSYYPDDSKTMKLFKRLEKKAKRKYGENIELVDISIGDNQSAITIPLYVAGGVGYLTGISIASGGMVSEDSYDSKKNTEMSGMSAAGFGVAFGSLFSYFFKGVKATATVVKSNEPVKYVFSTEEEIKEKKQNVFREKVYERVSKFGSSILINSCYIDSINSVGGVDVCIKFTNFGDKTIKYVNFDLIPYNRVYDVTVSEIDGISKKRVQVVNFIKQHDTYTAEFENVWYNSTISTIEIVGIEIIYVDNTKSYVNDKEDILHLFYTEEEKDCIKEIIQS
ncbi:MAG: hypothetical protein IIX47_02505 [Spirochaetaceae bacterium]|nr:hypothetical protein [Spirochaetaceae bacterium]